MPYLQCHHGLLVDQPQELPKPHRAMLMGCVNCEKKGSLDCFPHFWMDRHDSYVGKVCLKYR